MFDVLKMSQFSIVSLNSIEICICEVYNLYENQNEIKMKMKRHFQSLTTLPSLVLNLKQLKMKHIFKNSLESFCLQIFISNK